MDDAPSINVGAVLTISLFLILLTFFILLNSIAVIDDRRSRVAIGSLIGAFGSFKGGLSPFKSGDLTTPPSAPLIDESLDVKELLSLINAKIPGEIKVEPSKERDIITINKQVLFHKHSFELKSSSYPLLDKLCSFIKKGDYPVEIIGHTDNRPAEEKGQRSNWELTSLMAIKLLRYFVEKGKIPPERLTAYGCSSHKPLVTNDTIESRAQNRRVEIILHSKMSTHIKRIYRKKPAGLITYKKFDFKIF